MNLFPSHPWKPQKFTETLRDIGQAMSQVDYMKKIGERLNYKQMEDWYQIKKDDVISEDSGKSLLLLYDNAPNAVMHIFEDHPWNPWEFEKLRLNRFWMVQKNRDAYFEYLKKNLKITKPEDWYTVGHISLPKYEGFISGTSLYKELKERYKDHEWVPWMFDYIPPNSWKDPAMIRQYLNFLKVKLDIKTSDDWHKVTPHDFNNNYGGSLMSIYDNNCYKLISSLLPEVNLKPWKYRITRWTKELSKPYLENLGEKLGYKKMEDWYRITVHEVRSNGGAGLIDMHSNVRDAIMQTFHDHPWQPWRFTMPGFWPIRSNRALFFDYMFKKLGYTSMNDWYKVKASDFDGSGVQIGRSIRELISIKRALMSTYPDHEWQEWRFRNFSLFSANPEHVISYVHSLGTLLNVKSLHDWYYVTYDQVKQHGSFGIKKLGLAKALQIAYPKHSWDQDRFVKGFANTERQRRIMAMLQKIYPTTQIIENYRHPSMRFETGGPVVSDIFIPSLNISMEYQGEQHVLLNNPMFGNKEISTMQTDREKKEMLEALGYIHILIPHWWDGTQTSLVSFMRENMPDNV